MHSASMLYLILGSHGLLFLSVLMYAKLAECYLRPSQYLWMSVTPVFGPVTGWILMRTHGTTPRLADRTDRSEKNQRITHHQMPVSDMVPLEEALLINDPQKRRALMMHVLRSDPMQYLDLLLVARFNNDTETAHYATATIMELQRHFQLEIHQMLAELAKSEGNIEKHRQYAKYLSTYCESGLLEGQLLRRQRLVLKNALEHCLRLEEDPSMLHIAVRNSLALEDAEEARMAAQKLMMKWPLDESSWLAGMRVCAETRDQNGMRTLLENMDSTPVDFTAKGREQMLFWRGKRT